MKTANLLYSSNTTILQMIPVSIVAHGAMQQIMLTNDDMADLKNMEPLFCNAQHVTAQKVIY